jgi:hypothetical protein
MKHLSVLFVRRRWTAVWLFALALFAAENSLAGENSAVGAPAFFNWGLLWAGSWDEGKILHNRGELRLGFPPAGLVLRGQALDKRVFDFSLSPPWDDSSKTVTNFAGGLYHSATGSRLLYGILDEWGLSARIRSPWIRSAPFAENRKPQMADIKTVPSSSKEPEAYLYLSSPQLFPLKGVKLRGFASAQTKTSAFQPDFSGGLEALFGKKHLVSLESFFTSSTLAAKKSSAWFSSPAPLPEREFRLFGAGLLYDCDWLSISSDWAYSETFAWGRDIYGSLGLRLSFRPWAVSVAADGAGARYTGRDGSSPGAGFRTAGKFEWKGVRSSLFRFGSTVQSGGLGESFNRSSTNVYYRFAAPQAKSAAAAFPLRMSRVSFTADRNATNSAKIIDGFDGSVGLSLSLPAINLPGFSAQAGAGKSRGKASKGSPLGINFSGSVKSRFAAEEILSPFPLPEQPYQFESAKAAAELYWPPGIFQFRTKWGYSLTAKKEGVWDASFSTAVRFKYGRFSVKAESANLKDDWTCTLSWRLEKKQ